LKRNFSGLNEVSVKSANSSRIDTAALAMIHAIMVKTVTMMDTNGMIAKADINSHLANTRNLITSGIKNVIASFMPTKKAVLRPFLCLSRFIENDLYLQIASLHLYHLQILLY